MNFNFGFTPKFDVKLQGEPSECGLACIAMVMGHYGESISISALRRELDLSARGLTLGAMRDILSSLGVQSRGVRLDIDEMNRLQLPSILHMDENHYVVLVALNRAGYVIADPALGMRRVERGYISRHFTGIALDVAKPAMKIPSLRSDGRDKLWNFLGRLGRPRGIVSVLVIITLLSAILEALVLIGPLVVQFVLDRVTGSADMNLLISVCFGYLFIWVFQTTVGFFRGWVSLVLNASLAVGWGQNLFRKLLLLPDRYFHSRSIGDISSRFSGIESLGGLVSISAVEAALDGVFALGTLAVIFYYSSTVAVVAIISLLLYVMVKLVSFDKIRDSSLNLISLGAKKESIFIESVKCQMLLRVSNAQGMQVSRYVDSLVDFWGASSRLNFLQSLYRSIGLIVTGGGRVVLIFIGARFIDSGEFTAGMLVASLAYLDQFLGRCAKLVDYFFSLKVMDVYVERLKDISDSPVENELYRKVHGVREGHGISLRGVYFRYGENDRVVLNGVDFDINMGDVAVITGASGSGKSTIAKIISGVVVQNAGEVMYGGVEYGQIGKMRVRDFISIVSAGDVVMGGSIAQNVSMFDLNPNYDRIIECCRISSIHDDIMCMPMQYETSVGLGSEVLSSGQLQRIHIARALYRQPRLLVLDEATSMLDVATESRIIKGIRSLGIMVLLVAHRPETMRHADALYELRDGRLRGLSLPSSS